LTLLRGIELELDVGVGGCDDVGVSGGLV